MKKDFDGSAWASAHKDGFQDLIALARRKPKSAKEESVGENPTERIPEAVSILIPSSPTDRIVTPPFNLTDIPARISVGTTDDSTAENS